jgi:hypothetical protein
LNFLLLVALAEASRGGPLDFFTVLRVRLCLFRVCRVDWFSFVGCDSSGAVEIYVFDHDALLA